VVRRDGGTEDTCVKARLQSCMYWCCTTCCATVDIQNDNSRAETIRAGAAVNTCWLCWCVRQIQAAITGEWSQLLTCASDSPYVLMLSVPHSTSAMVSGYLPPFWPRSRSSSLHVHGTQNMFMSTRSCMFMSLKVHVRATQPVPGACKVQERCWMCAVYLAARPKSNNCSHCTQEAARVEMHNPVGKSSPLHD
jgi:hypothetical protein